MLIVLTTGPEDRGSRATLAFALGVASLISGVPTTIYMTMGGTFWSRGKAHETVHVPGFSPLTEYVEQFTTAGGTLMVCSPCNDFYCAIATDGGLIEGAELCGLATIVDLALGASTLTL
jgi:predicted peroxiredoxin